MCANLAPAFGVDLVCAGVARQVAERERSRQAVLILTEPEFLNGPAHGAAVARALKPADDLQVLAHGEPGIRGGALHKVTDPPPHAGCLGVDAPAEQLGMPCGR